MYAIFQNGGKQYCVVKDQTIDIEKVNMNVGDFIEFDRVMFIKDEYGIQIGYPFIENKKILAEIVLQGRAKKINIVKFRRRKHFRKFQGHRQNFTRVKILNI